MVERAFSLDRVIGKRKVTGRQEKKGGVSDCRNIIPYRLGTIRRYLV